MHDAGTFVLLPDGDVLVNGWLHDHAGNPIAGVRVGVEYPVHDAPIDWAVHPGIWSRTGPDGSFVLRGTATTTLRLWLESDRHAFVTQPLFRAGERGIVVQGTPPGWLLASFVLHAPLDQIWVWLRCSRTGAHRYEFGLNDEESLTLIEEYEPHDDGDGYGSQTETEVPSQTRRLARWCIPPGRYDLVVTRGEAAKTVLFERRGIDVRAGRNRPDELRNVALALTR